MRPRATLRVRNKSKYSNRTLTWERNKELALFLATFTHFYPIFRMLPAHPLISSSHVSCTFLLGITAPTTKSRVSALASHAANCKHGNAVPARPPAAMVDPNDDHVAAEALMGLQNNVSDNVEHNWREMGGGVGHVSYAPGLYSTKRKHLFACSPGTRMTRTRRRRTPSPPRRRTRSRRTGGCASASSTVTLCSMLSMPSSMWAGTGGTSWSRCSR